MIKSYLLSAALLALSLAASTAAAQDDDKSSPRWGEGRILRGHLFPFAQFVPSAFIVSSFAVRAALELRSVPQFASEPLSGAGVRSIDLSTLNAVEGIDVSIRVHRMVALLATAYGRARVGVNTDTLLSTGADFSLGADAGAQVRLLRLKTFQLSFRGTMGLYGGRQAGIGHFYQSARTVVQRSVRETAAGTADLAQQTAIFEAALQHAADQLVTSTSGWHSRLALTAAQALCNYAGLQATLGFLYDRGYDVTNAYDAGQTLSAKLHAVDRLTQVTLGVALDFGASDKRAIPVDFVLEYVMQPTRIWRDVNPGPVTVRNALAHRLAFEVLYAGRSDLQLGLGFYALLAQARQLGVEDHLSGRPHELGASFDFRYIW